MFSVGFTEIILITVVAILVLGPEKLPECGRLIGKALRQYRIFKDDVTQRVRETVRVDDPPKAENPSTPEQSP